MDWIDWHFITGMFAGAAAWVLGWFGPGLVRALRRSEPRLESYEAEDGESGLMMQHRMSNGHIRFHPAREPCGPHCNPQPTQSERRSKAGAGRKEP